MPASSRADPLLLERFAERMLDDMLLLDVLGSWLPGEERFRERLSGAVAVRLRDLEPYYHERPVDRGACWTDGARRAPVRRHDPQAVRATRAPLRQSPRAAGVRAEDAEGGAVGRGCRGAVLRLVRGAREHGGRGRRRGVRRRPARVRGLRLSARSAREAPWPPCGAHRRGMSDPLRDQGAPLGHARGDRRALQRALGAAGRGRTTTGIS